MANSIGGPSNPALKKTAAVAALYNARGQTRTTKKSLNDRSKTSLLDELYERKLIDKTQYEASLPEFIRTSQCYIRTVLDQRLWNIVDEYVIYASALLARGSLILNQWVSGHWDLFDVMTDDYLTNQSFLKHMFLPTRTNLDEDIVDYLDMRLPDLLGPLIEGIDVAKFSPYHVQDQTLNFAVRAYIGHVKVHVKCHLGDRLQALFIARHQEAFSQETAQAQQHIVRCMLRNQDAPGPWSARVQQFRDEFGLAALVFVVNWTHGDVVEEADEDDGGDEAVPQEEEYDGEEADEEADEDTVDRRAKADLKLFWPIHCKVIKALWDERQLQDVREEKVSKKKRIKTASLLPIMSYKRSYVPIDRRIMLGLTRIYNNSCTSERQRVEVVNEEMSLVRHIRVAERKQLRRVVRKKKRASGKATAPKERRYERTTRCGHGMWKTPNGALLTSIRTDGVGASLYFTIGGRKPEKLMDSIETAESLYAKAKRPFLNAHDPGDVNITTSSSAVIPKDLDITEEPSSFWMRSIEGSAPVSWNPEHATLSRKTYYQRSLINKSRLEERRRRAGNPAYQAATEALMRAGTWRTPDPDAFSSMCGAMCAVSGALMSEGIVSKARAKWKMLLKRRKRSCLDQHAQRVLSAMKDKKVDLAVVLYGNKSTRTTRGPAVPKKETKQAFRRALNRFRDHFKIPVAMLSQEEFRTTMLCRHCHHVMRPKMKKMPGAGNMCTDRNFRCCAHCGTTTHPKLRSRDGNAADNIMYKGWVRLEGRTLPTAFQRSSHPA
jgi:hypothetical protein